MVDDYFVKIQNDFALQSALLETAKESLLSSQQYYSLLEIRKEKSSLLSDLSQQMTALKETYQDLLTQLPHQELVAEEKKRRQKTKQPVKKAASKKVSKSASKSLKSLPKAAKKQSPEEALKESLAQIEKKLSQLS